MMLDSRFGEAYVQECVERQLNALERIATALERLIPEPTEGFRHDGGESLERAGGSSLSPDENDGKGRPRDSNDHA